MLTAEWLNKYESIKDKLACKTEPPAGGDGYYPVYFGYDAQGKVCAVYVRLIDIEASYREQA